MLQAGTRHIRFHGNFVQNGSARIAMREPLPSDSATAWANRPVAATHRIVPAAARTGIFKSRVAHYFALFGLQLNRSKSFKLSSQPFFVEKNST